MKRFWQKHRERITDNVIENHETYAFGMVLYGLIAVLGFAHNIYRHTIGLYDFWFISSVGFLLLAIVHVYFLARARTVRRLRDGQTN